MDSYLAISSTYTPSTGSYSYTCGYLLTILAGCNSAPVLAGAAPEKTTGKSRNQERKERKEESRKSQSAAKSKTGLVKVQVTDKEQVRQEEKRKTTAEEGDT